MDREARLHAMMVADAAAIRGRLMVEEQEWSWPQSVVEIKLTDRQVKVLRRLRSGEWASRGEGLARAIGLPKATIFRITERLHGLEMIEFDRPFATGIKMQMRITDRGRCALVKREMAQR